MTLDFQSSKSFPLRPLATQALKKREIIMAIDFVGIGEAAKILGLSRTSVQKLVDSGQLPAVKTTGGHRRIPSLSIEKLNQKMGPKAMRRLAASQTDGPNQVSPQLGNFDTSEHVQVLIVEDDAVMAQALMGMFEAHYPEVKCTLAKDGLEAVLQLERTRPRILITDLNMEPFDGFRLLNMVCSRDEYKSIATLVLSGLSDQEIKKRGGLPQEVLFLSKPVNMERLRGFLDAHVQIHRQIRVAA
jgi:excisionase family DNA binding protein